MSEAVCRGACCLLAALLAVVTVRATAAEDCPPGNLLAGRSPAEVRHVAWPATLTDGVLSLPSDPWDTHLSAVLEASDAEVVYDLGAPRQVRAVVLQGDGSRRFRIETSLDGASWSEIAVTPAGAATAMPVHRGHFEARGRYLRVRLAEGEAPTGLAEVQAFCEAPPDLAPPLRFRQGRPRLAPLESIRRDGWGVIGLALLCAATLAALGAGRAARARTLPRWRWIGGMGAGVAAAAGALALTWGPAAALLALALPAAALAVHWRVEAPRLLRVAAFGSLILAAAPAWSGFSSPGSTPRHVHDIFHYVMGSRYAAELGYTRLYHCAIVAESQGDPGRDLTLRAVRDLRDGSLGTAGPLVDREEECLERFAPARWASFRADVEGFRGQMSESQWARVFEDHGYNAPPTWSLLGRLLSGSRPVDPARVARWTRIDPLLYLACLALLAWAFGIETAALAAVVLVVGFPWGTLWIGGAFGRSLWFAAMTTAVCLVRRGAPLAGGVAWALAVLLRLFPLLAGVGLAIHGLVETVRARRVHRPTARFLAGAVLCGALLIPFSTVAVGGADGLRAFVENTRRHESGASLNRLGWSVLVAWHPDRTAERLYDWGLRDPSTPYVDGQARTLRERRVVHVAGIVLGTLLVVLVAARRGPPWSQLLLSSGLAMMLLDLASYYYAIVVLFAPLAAPRARAWAPLLAVVAATTLVRATLSMSFEVPFVLDSALLIALWAWLALVGWTGDADDPAQDRPSGVTRRSPASGSTFEPIQAKTE